MDFLRAGIDALYVAIQGQLSAADMERIARAKEIAVRERRVVSTEIGPGRVAIEMQPHGSVGGYPFSFETGPIGERWACRPPFGNDQWNLFVRPYAAGLVARGYAGTVAQIFERLEAMGARVAAHSVNRVDYAIDIRDDHFLMDMDRFVTPPRGKVRAYWSEVMRTRDHYVPSFVLAGRRLETVLIGKATNRQIVVYDKSSEVRTKRQPMWWPIWGIDPEDSGAVVWRVELRAGRRELKDRRKIRTLTALETEFRPVLQAMVRDVRYLEHDQTDSNVSRRRLHPLWKLVTAHIDEAQLFSSRGEISEERILEITRRMKIEQYESLILGNCAGLAAVRELSNTEVRLALPNMVRGLISREASDPNGRFQKSIERACERLSSIIGSRKKSNAA